MAIPRKPDTTLEFTFAHYPMTLRVLDTRLGRFVCENVLDETTGEYVPYGWSPVVTPDIPDTAPKSYI